MNGFGSSSGGQMKSWAGTTQQPPRRRQLKAKQPYEKNENNNGDQQTNRKGLEKTENGLSKDDKIYNDTTCHVPYRLFPIYSIYFLTAFTLWSRLLLVASPENLYMVHPDEVYQSIEVAHSEVYGYGFRPYEFFSSPSNSTNHTLTNSEQRHATLGMYSMRSWLHPQFYQLVFQLRDAAFTYIPPFLFAKTIHAAISAFLPLSIFRFSLRIYSDTDAAFISAFFVAFTQSLIILGIHTFIQSLLSPLTFWLLTTMLIINATHFALFACGTLLGVLTYVRLDTYLVIAAVATTTIIPIINKGWLTLLGYFSGFVLGGCMDNFSYGVWFISARRWLSFQMNYAHLLFGQQPFLTYFNLIISNSHISVILGVISLGLVIFKGFYASSHFCRRNEKILFGFVRMWWSCLVLLLIYSCHQHKEYRFVHDAIVLFQVCMAGVAVVLYREVYRFLEHTVLMTKSRQLFLKLILYGELLLFAMEGRMRCPVASDASSLTSWAYSGLTESGLVNQGLEFISRQSDVTGIVIDYSVHMTGGYTLIHRDVPIIAKTHYEFREWDKKSRLNLANASVSIIDRVSNFISVYNAQLLLKLIINKPEYNYVLTTESRKMPNRGFLKVFSASDNVQVYKRRTSKASKEALRKMEIDLPIGSNAMVLEYESSWLITLELYSEAVDRLKAAAKLNPQRVRVWQLLYLAYSKLQRVDEAEEAIRECYRLLNVEKCHEQQEKVVFHPEYQLNL